MAGPPLRRTSDRVEEFGRRGWRVLALLGIPIAIAIALGWHAHAAANAQSYAATVHLADAVTLEGTASSTMTPPIAGGYVTARWTGPDESERHGTVEVPIGTSAGEHVPVWLTDDGDLANAPPARTQLLFDAGFVALTIVLITAGIAYLAYCILRLGLDRWRLHEWDRAWARFDAHQRREP
jgi:hypothetical protein